MSRQISSMFRAASFKLAAPILTITMALSGAGIAGAAPISPPVKNPPAEDLERATELYDNGKGLYDEGSYEGAAMAFLQAYELSGDIDLLYNVSLAYDRAQNFEEALKYLEGYRALAPESERAGLGKKVDSLKTRLASQRTDEADAAAAGANSDAEGDPDEDGGANGDGSDGSGESTDGSSDRDKGPRIFTPLAGVFAGLTGVGLGLGTGLGLASRAATNRVKDDCSGNLCPTGASGDIDTARGLAIGADVAYGIGSAAAIGLIVVLAINASKRKKARSGASAMFVPLRRGAAVSISF